MFIHYGCYHYACRSLCMFIMHAEHYACRYIMHADTLCMVIMHACSLCMHVHYACMSLCMHVHYSCMSLCMLIMQVLASQLHFLANRKAELDKGTTCCTAVSGYCLFPLKFCPISSQSCVFLPNHYIKAIRAVKLLQYTWVKKLIQISREFHYGLFPWVYREQIVT